MKSLTRVVVITLLLVLCTGIASAGNFSATWNTSKISTGSSNSTAISLPLESGGTYDFTVYWGDGNSDYITVWDQTNTTHNYSSAGVYEINMSGTLQRFSFNNIGDKLKIIDVKQWGDLEVGNSGGYFYGCSNFNASATDVLNLTLTINDMGRMFKDASLFNQNLSTWDVVGITSMYEMFSGAAAFNQNVTKWNTTNVQNMAYMFYGASSFNQDISDWDVASVSNMGSMLRGTSAFNQDLSGWDVSIVTSMGSMFNSASSFNQDISNWNVKNVTSMYEMFSGATSFDQNIGDWNVSSLSNAGYMFNGVTLSLTNYDPLLIGWSELPSLQNGVAFHGGNSQYSPGAAATARNSVLGGTYSWSITDGGEAPEVYIDFVDPTPVNDTYEQYHIETNVTAATGGTLSLIVTRLYNSSGLVIQNSSATSHFYWNITGLAYDTYYLNATANNTLGVVNTTETRTIILGIISPPNITSYGPTETIWTEVYDSQTFNITVNQSVKCHWYVNGSLMEFDSALAIDHDYTNTSLLGGGCNVTAVVSNPLYSDSQTWLFEVGADSVDCVVLKYQHTNQTLVTEINVTRIGGNVTDWGWWQNHTMSGWRYFFRFGNGTEITNHAASYSNESLWFNGTPLLPTGVYYIDAEDNANTVMMYADEQSLINAWSSAQTYQQIGDDIPTAECFSYYDYTSGMWEAYRPGYSYNDDMVVPQNCSVFVFVPGDANASTTPCIAITIPQYTWFCGFLPGNAAKTLTEIEAEMNADGLDVWSLQGYDNSTQSYTTTGSYSVAPNMGFAVYCNNTGEYTP